MRTLKIATIQLHSRPLDLAHNFSRAAHFIAQAAAQGCDLAVLPEYCLTGWAPTDPRFGDAVQEHRYLDKFCHLAKTHTISLVPGTFVETHVSPSGENLLYNTAYFITATGTIAGSYTKKNLWHPERAHLEASPSPHSVLDTPLGKVGLLICWDLAFPEAFRALIAQGAEVIVVPSFWTLNDVTPEGLLRNKLSEEVYLNAMCVARAFENEVVVVFSNAGGREERGYAGLSQVCVPFVGCLARVEGRGEGMAVAEVDMKILEEAEENYKVREDLERVRAVYGGGDAGSKL